MPQGIDLRYLAAPSHHRLPSPSERAGRPTLGGVLRIASRLHQEPHQVAVSWPNQPLVIQIRAWGAHADELATKVPDLLGFNDRTARDFEPSRIADTFEPHRGELTPQQRVTAWHAKHPGLRLTKNLSVLDTLVPIIIAQRILGKEAKHIHRRLFRYAAEEAPGPPGIKVPPSPEALRNIGYETWHQMGLERSRARLIHRCAAEASRLESWRDLDTETLYSNLTAIPRIGPWTANRLLYALGHSDAVWIGDYNLPSFAAWNLEDVARADDQRLLELLEPFRGQRARVLRLMELEGSGPPRFGARLPLRNIQAH